MVEPLLKTKVYLVDWTSDWKTKFDEESEFFKGIIGSVCVEIHHIGSTAVKGIKAKPIVDILAVVQSHQVLDQSTSALIKLGYEVKGENGLAGRRYFQKDVNGERAFHIHAFEEGDRQIDSHFKFRDSLRNSPVLASEYEQLKIALAQKHAHNKPAYTKAKHTFIQRVLGNPDS